MHKGKHSLCMCALCSNMCMLACLPVLSGHDEHLIPYSLVQPVQVQTKRPVIFSPSLLSRGLIERLLQPAESGLNFNTCPPGMHTAYLLIHTHDLQTFFNWVNKDVENSSFDHHNIASPVFPVVWRTYSGFRETRQKSILVGFLHTRAGSGHTAAVNTGCHQPGDE